MKKALLALLAVLVLIAGSLWGCATRRVSHTPTANEIAFWDAAAEDFVSEPFHFQDYSVLEGYAGDMISLLRTGLAHDKPLVRWFACYKTLEFLGQKEAGAFPQDLRKLCEDQVEYVREAAEFALALFEGSYDHPWVALAANQAYVAFYRFHAARFNDREVWWLENGSAALAAELDGSIDGLLFSPDSKLLAVNISGYSWAGLDLLDIGQKRLRHISPWSYLEHQGIGLGFDQHARPDPQVVAIEWSEDSQYLLARYAYFDAEHEQWRGYALYDAAEGRFTAATHPRDDIYDLNEAKTVLGW